MKMKKCLAGLLAAASLFGLSACTGGEPGGGSPSPSPSPSASQGTNPAPVEGGTPVSTELRVGLPGPVGSYRYGHTASGTDSLIWEVYDAVIFTDPTTMDFTSNVLDFHYDDEYTLVLEVKPGVLFTDGTQLTGEDVLFSIQCHTDPAYASNFASKLNVFNFEKSHVSDDGMTVYLITDEVDATAMANLCVPVYSRAWCEERGWEHDDWYNAPNGTGPYIVKETAVGLSSTVALKDEVKNGTYWNAAFKTDIETVVVTHYDDKSVMFIDLENGDIDLALQIDAADYDRIEANGLTHLTGVLKPYDDVQILTFDISSGPTTDENLRAAICHGVNWSDVALAAWESYGQPASSILASSMGEMYSNVGNYEYDPELARQYADQVTGSKEVEICIFTDNLYVQECEVIRAYLEQIGITLKVTTTDMASYFANCAAGAGELDLIRYPNGNFTYEPYLCLYKFEAGSSFPNQNLGADSTICDLLLAARQTQDRSQRAELYAQIQQYMKDHYYAAPIAEIYGAFAYNNTRWSGGDIIAINAANLRYVYPLYQ